MALTRTHWGLLALLSIALIIDIMKPASLGFVTPGMRGEYGLKRTIDRFDDTASVSPGRA